LLLKDINVSLTFSFFFFFPFFLVGQPAGQVV
jgi:hypothetical protein